VYKQFKDYDFIYIHMCEIQSELFIKRLNTDAIIPSRGSKFSAGLDISSSVDTIVPAKGKAIIKTGLSIACPFMTYARIAPRSGLTVKKFIDVGAGVVDCDYRGEIGVVLFNFSDIDFQVRKGDKIAQMIIEKICMFEPIEVDELIDTHRGDGGFGSTDFKKCD